MLLIGENRRGISRSLHWTAILRIIVAIFLLAGLTAHSPGQLPHPLPARFSKGKPTATHVAPFATTPAVLGRADHSASGKIWTVSEAIVAKIPELYAQMESEAPTSADDVLPAVVTRPQPSGISAVQWLKGLLSVPICWALAWLSTFLFSARGRVLSKLRKLHFWSVWQTPLGMPLRCILAISMHSFFVYQQLQLPILYRAR